MPPVSEKQRRAMRAAAEGKSNIGIPKKVGKEYSAADKGGKLPKQAPASPKSEAAGDQPPKTYEAHEAREKATMGAGYEAHEAAEQASYRPGGTHTPPRANVIGPSSPKRDGHLRLSGHSGAHRIGKR